MTITEPMVWTAEDPQPQTDSARILRALPVAAKVTAQLGALTMTSVSVWSDGEVKVQFYKVSYEAAGIYAASIGLPDSSLDEHVAHDGSTMWSWFGRIDDVPVTVVTIADAEATEPVTTP